MKTAKKVNGIMKSKALKAAGIKKKKTEGKLKNAVKLKQPPKAIDPNNVKEVNKNDKLKKKSAKKVEAGADKAKNKRKKSHKDQIEGLKDIDPEFYDFLKKNDKKLLEFNLYDSEEDLENDDDEDQKQKDSKQKSKKTKSNDESDNDDEEEESDHDDDDDEKYHTPSEKLEVASDESDFEDDEADADADEDGTKKITLNLLRQWQQQLQKPNVRIEVVRKVIQGFSSALASISGDDQAQTSPAPYKVSGAAVFNGVVQLCVLHLQSAILRVLGLPANSSMALHKTKKWTKVRSCLRYYLTDLIRLIDQVSSTNILTVLLKHLHQMAGMLSSFTALSKTILKRLITLWSTGDETVRVLAFLCILKITRNQQVSMLHHVLKAMYLSYVRNSKFVSPNTLPSINFMRRSLVEMFALDLNVSYQHAFLYIRQLAIHLRNAVILKKKDSFQAVYNWQYVNSLRLWAELLSTTANKTQLQPLIYPLVTITIGAIRLIPTAQYFPLRFHCLQALILLSKETQTYVPVLPLLLEVLRSNTFNRKHTAVSMRPLQFTCLLRLNKTQLAENGFRDEVIEQVFGLTLEYLAHESVSLAYSDLVVPAVMAIKSYLKSCRNANYSRKLKQLLDKMQENARYIDQERGKINFGLKDVAQVQAWETKLRNKGTPLSIYYGSWVKTHETKKRRQAAQSDAISADYDVPMIKRQAKGDKQAVRNENGEVELFPSDSEDEGMMNMEVDDEEDATAEKVKKPKKQKKPKKTKKVDAPEVDVPIEEPDGDEEVDIVKDLDLDDW